MKERIVTGIVLVAVVFGFYFLLLTICLVLVYF
ncbi:putative membrane protein [Francisella tularensis]|nr:putative membrane protein [Francisella tularensis]